MFYMMSLRHMNVLSKMMSVLVAILAFLLISQMTPKVYSLETTTLSNDSQQQQQAQWTPNLNELLLKCASNHANLSSTTCDMCSLCQNGAFCKQKSKRPLSPTAPSTLNPLARPTTAQQMSLAFLKTLFDFNCYCVPGYTGTYCQIDINECLSMPCSNNATCLDLINTYECRCPSGFTGDHCEININECDSSPCAFGSECIDLVDGYYCQCKPGYTGLTCSTEIDECSSDPCMNQGKCVDLINRFECDCTSTGFQGLLCETNINDCENVTCEHNGTCIDGINAYKCECFAGYEGTRCEKDVNECALSPCIYGKCWENSNEQSFMRRQRLTQQELSDTNTTLSPFDYSQAAGYWCECIPGYTGANCEIKINECMSNPCGMNGECLDLVNEYQCKCYPGFSGKQCSTVADRKT